MLGLIALGYALGPFIPLGIAGFAVVALLPQAAKLVLPTLCAALLAAVALVGFDVVLDFLVRLVAPDRRPPIAVGLVLALAVFGAVAYLVVHGSWSQVRVKRRETGRRPGFEVLQPIQRTRTRSLVVAAVLALLVIVALPPLLGMRERNARAVAPPQQVKAQLDVLIVAGAPQPRAHRGAGGTGDVSPYTDTAGEVSRWRRIAPAAAPAGTPAYALLETTKPSRLKRWTRFLTPGGAISLQALGSQKVTDAAVRLGVAAPTAREDFTLAMRYRPVLLFDRAEDVPRPLSIEDLFAQGKVRESTGHVAELRISLPRPWRRRRAAAEKGRDAGRDASKRSIHTPARGIRPHAGRHRQRGGQCETMCRSRDEQRTQQRVRPRGPRASAAAVRGGGPQA